MRAHQAEKSSARQSARGSTSGAAGATRGAPGRYAGLSIAVTLVCAAVVAVHWPALNAHALFLDDHQYVIENPLVRNCGWDSVTRFLGEVRKPSTVAGYYQPLTMISLMLDCAAGANPSNLRAFHITNLALHAGNTALIIVILYQLFGTVWVAAGVGLLFGMHPITVEPLAWVTERKTLLAAFFTLAALAVYVWQVRRPGWPRYAACLALFGLALLSKPTSTPLPVLLLLVDWWPLHRLSWHSVAEKVPFFVLAGLSAWITVISQHGAAGLEAPTRGDPQVIALTLCHNVALYLAHIAWPANLSPHYPFPDSLHVGSAMRTIWSAQTICQRMIVGGAVITAVLAILLPLSLRWTRAFAAGVLFSAVALLPTSGVVGFTYVVAADKYLYLPVLGLLLIVAGGLARWPGKPRATNAGTGLKPSFNILLGGSAAIVLLAGAEAHAARTYLAHWRDTEGLHRYVLERTPEAYAVRCNLAAFLLDSGRTDDAIRELEWILARRADHWKARSTLASALQRKGQTDEAIAQLEEALRLNPEDFAALSKLGWILNECGRFSEAVACYKAARHQRPADYGVQVNLGNALLAQGQIQAALDCYDEALRLKPRYARGHFDRGVALSRLGRSAEAAGEFRLTLDIDPQHKGARQELEALANPTTKQSPP